MPPKAKPKATAAKGAAKAKPKPKPKPKTATPPGRRVKKNTSNPFDAPPDPDQQSLSESINRARLAEQNRIAEEAGAAEANETPTQTAHNKRKGPAESMNPFNSTPDHNQLRLTTNMFKKAKHVEESTPEPPVEQQATTAQPQDTLEADLERVMDEMTFDDSQDTSPAAAAGADMVTRQQATPATHDVQAKPTHIEKEAEATAATATSKLDASTPSTQATHPTQKIQQQTTDAQQPGPTATLLDESLDTTQLDATMEPTQTADAHQPVATLFDASSALTQLDANTEPTQTADAQQPTAMLLDAGSLTQASHLEKTAPHVPNELRDSPAASAKASNDSGEAQPNKQPLSPQADSTGYIKPTIPTMQYFIDEAKAHNCFHKFMDQRGEKRQWNFGDRREGNLMTDILDFNEYLKSQGEAEFFSMVKWMQNIRHQPKAETKDEDPESDRLTNLVDKLHDLSSNELVFLNILKMFQEIQALVDDAQLVEEIFDFLNSRSEEDIEQLCNQATVHESFNSYVEGLLKRDPQLFHEWTFAGEEPGQDLGDFIEFLLIRPAEATSTSDSTSKPLSPPQQPDLTQPNQAKQQHQQQHFSTASEAPDPPKSAPQPKDIETKPMPQLSDQHV